MNDLRKLPGMEGDMIKMFDGVVGRGKVLIGAVVIAPCFIKCYITGSNRYHHVVYRNNLFVCCPGHCVGRLSGSR